MTAQERIDPQGHDLRLKEVRVPMLVPAARRGAAGERGLRAHRQYTRGVCDE